LNDELIITEKRRFGKTISPGTVYCILLRLEQKGLIKPKIHRGSKVYELTDEGQEILSAFKTSCLRMLPGLMNLLEIVNDKE
jgi:DNA-binding PadR family transcriptional regulator